MVVLDAEAAILYVNRAAEQMTGYAREGLDGRDFTELVSPGQRAEPGAHRQAGGRRRQPRGRSTSRLSTTSGEAMTVSVSSSPVLAEHGGAVLAFRDVTEARALEGELRKTKDFLERLIDSTVDGIIAADMRGNIIIFNQGAARLYGYSPGEVVGKLPVWKLYPDGVARAIMTELRSSDHGGVGRMEPSRREIVTKDGELVPVSLAASIVYEDGARDRHRRHRLATCASASRSSSACAQAQEKLLVTEKQALIAELAGTTAHELNQPLTSVMGYAELLQEEDAARRRALPRGRHHPARGRAHGRDRAQDRQDHPLRDQGLRRLDADPRSRQEHHRWLSDARRQARAMKKPAKPKAARTPKLKPPTHEAVMQAAFELSRQLSLEVREEELIGTFAATLRRALARALPVPARRRSAHAGADRR